LHTPTRLRHLFVCVETGGLRSLEENLNGAARASGVAAAIPDRRRDGPLRNSPAKLAEKVYGGRLGNFKPGDGYTYRGSGLLQNTGRANFEEVEAATALPSQSGTAALLPWGAAGGPIYWTKCNINALADRSDTVGVCKAVNGGAIGLADQKTWLAKAAKVWPDGAAIIFPTPQAAPPAPAQPVPAPQLIPDNPAVCDGQPA